jgi:hypothetical protein
MPEQGKKSLLRSIEKALRCPSEKKSVLKVIENNYQYLSS